MAESYLMPQAPLSSKFSGKPETQGCRWAPSEGFVTKDMFGYIAAALTTVAFLPQVLRVWRTRSAKDISLPMYALFVTGVAFWILYGVLIQSPPVIWANGVTFLLSSAVLVAKLRFDRRA